MKSMQGVRAEWNHFKLSLVSLGKVPLSKPFFCETVSRYHAGIKEKSVPLMKLPSADIVIMCMPVSVSFSRFS
jgi:hypothetical protein